MRERGEGVKKQQMQEVVKGGGRDWEDNGGGMKKGKLQGGKGKGGKRYPRTGS